MKAIICGATQIGYSIAAYLAAKENDIIVIDESAERIAYVQETLDVQAIQGCGAHPDLLESLGAASADLLIAVMQSDEQNIISCQIADSLFKIPKKIAHIRNQSYLNSVWIKKPEYKIPIDYIISPEQQVARVILSNLQVPGTMEVVSLTNSHTVVISIHMNAHCPMNNIPLQQIGEQFPQMPFRALTIIRHDHFIIPQAKDYLQANDMVYILIEKVKLQKFLSVFAINSEPIQRLVVAGGGNVGFYLAQGIQQSMPNVDLKIIESNKDRAQLLAQSLESAVVLHGSAVDINVLKEANVAQSDMFVAITNDDATNILSSLLAKNFGCLRVSTLVSNIMYPKFLPSLGIDSILNPSFVTISKVLNHVRRGLIQSVHVLQGGSGEIFEATVAHGSEVIGSPISVLEHDKQSMVAGLIRDHVFSMPHSADIIEEGDQLILVLASKFIPKIEAMFRT
ncbi:MAG: Trk system potassium transporter TrkA [Alphaproteobacteria bacterium]